MSFGNEFLSDGDRVLQKGTNRCFLFEDALIYFDTAQSDRGAPPRQRVQHGLQLILVAHAGAASENAQFE